MGGHGHDHEPYKIPDYRIYKVEDVPKLVTVQKMLAAQGLKDPWLRNEVWRYNPKYFGTERSRIMTTFFRGFKVGFAAFVATAVISYAYEKANPSEHHGSGDHH